MDFIDQIRALAARAPKMLDRLLTEEATKNALVMPLINSLGYNVFDPSQVVPEFTADVGTKKGEKVDYALMKDDEPVILFECKKYGEDLNRHSSQLYRYFSVTPARIGVLTDGITYRFFSDLEESNKMDEKPFMEFNLLDFTDAKVAELKRFSLSIFDLEETVNAATELKYAKAIRQILAQQWVEPSDDFVKFFAAQVYSGRVTASVREQFSGIVHRVLHQFLNDRINRRLKSALEGDDSSATPTQAAVEPDEEDDESEDGIVTTEEEIEGYHIVKAIVREVIPGDRVYIRDTKSYCNVLFDNSTRKPICRLRFNAATRKYIGLFDGEAEDKLLIESLADIYKYSERLCATAKAYLDEENAG